MPCLKFLLLTPLVFLGLEIIWEGLVLGELKHRLSIANFLATREDLYHRDDFSPEDILDSKFRKNQFPRSILPLPDENFFCEEAGHCQSHFEIPQLSLLKLYSSQNTTSQFLKISHKLIPWHD